jgi:hypothetical protein
MRQRPCGTGPLPPPGHSRMSGPEAASLWSGGRRPPGSRECPGPSGVPAERGPLPAPGHSRMSGPEAASLWSGGRSGPRALANVRAQAASLRSGGRSGPTGTRECPGQAASLWSGGRFGPRPLANVRAQCPGPKQRPCGAGAASAPGALAKQWPSGARRWDASARGPKRPPLHRNGVRSARRVPVPSPWPSPRERGEGTGKRHVRSLATSGSVNAPPSHASPRA